MLDSAILLLLFFAFVSANLPWLNERFLLFIVPADGKRVWMRLLEWLIFLCLWVLLSLGMEKKLLGEIYRQEWEFYTVLVCLYAVFALPGFIYRHDLYHHLQNRKKRLK
jgi:hypothetical protein